MSAPNLFSYATSELSQDAVLCWLLAWADHSCAAADCELHDLGQAFLAALFSVADTRLPTGPLEVLISQQVKKADIVATVGTEHLLVIEDKIETASHSGQLDRYREELGAKFEGRELVCVYLKTGDQGNYTDVSRKGWSIFTSPT